MKGISRFFGMVSAIGLAPLAQAAVFYNQAWQESGAAYVGRTIDVGVADLNGDGKDDVWLVDPNGPSRVWLSDASGNLVDSGQALGASGTNAVALGDLDGDGDIDAVEAVFGAANTIWRNDGSGHFTATTLTGDTGLSFNVALADLNGDGALDLFVANFSGANTVWLNDNLGAGAAPTFTRKSGQPFDGSSSFSSDVALADLNGDGKIDAVVANTGANTVWLNDGSGLFSAGTAPTGSANNASSKTVALADFDGDGKLDAFFGDANANHVWRGDGAGNFTDTGFTFSSAASSQGLAVRDFNGDGRPDVYVANDFNFGADKLWLYNGTPSAGGGAAGTIRFVDSGIDFGVSYSTSVGLGDFDDDGQSDDLFVGAGATTTQPDHIWLHQSTAPLAFAAGQVLDTAALSHAVALGDLDGDGDLDAFVANSGVNKVLRNTGSLQFQTIQQIGNDTSRGVVLADFDQDGDLDAVVANFGGAPNRLWLNDGTGALVDSGIALGSGGSSQSTSIAAGNLNGDACPDVVIGNLGQADEVWLNSDTDPGAGISCQFAAGATTLPGAATLTESVAVADLNGDGLDDILLTIQDGSSALINNGAGTAYTAQALNQPAGVSMRKIALADLDGNASRPDAFGVSDTSGYFWPNTGGGGFGAAVASGLVGSSQDVAIADVDGAGGRDLFIVSDSGTNKVLLNDGSAGFSDSGISLPAVKGQAVALGDLDGDGDADAFIAADGLNVALRHDPNDAASRGLDINFDGRLNAFEDGVMTLRYLAGSAFRTDAILLQGALPPGSAVTSGDEIRAYIQGLIDAGTLDINGDSATTLFEDGIMIVRCMVGFFWQEGALNKGAVTPTSTRTTAADIRAYFATIGLGTCGAPPP